MTIRNRRSAAVLPAGRPSTIQLGRVIVNIFAGIMGCGMAIAQQPQGGERLHIPGTIVSIVPLPGMKLDKQTAHLERSRDGLRVSVVNVAAGKLREMLTMLRQPDFQANNKWSDVRIVDSTDSAMTDARVSFVSEREQRLSISRIMDDGVHAVRVIADIPKASADTTRGVVGDIETMLATIVLTEKTAPLPATYTMRVPNGFEDRGTPNTDVRVFEGASDSVVVIMRISDPIADDDLKSRVSAVAPNFLNRQMSQATPTGNAVGKDGRWSFAEYQFAGTRLKSDRPAAGFVRVIADAAKYGFIVAAYATPKLTEQQRADVLNALATIVVPP